MEYRESERNEGGEEKRIMIRAGEKNNSGGAGEIHGEWNIGE